MGRWPSSESLEFLEWQGIIDWGFGAEGTLAGGGAGLPFSRGNTLGLETCTGPAAAAWWGRALALLHRFLRAGRPSHRSPDLLLSLQPHDPDHCSPDWKTGSMRSREVQSCRRERRIEPRQSDSRGDKSMTFPGREPQMGLPVPSLEPAAPRCLLWGWILRPGAAQVDRWLWVLTPSNCIGVSGGGNKALERKEQVIQEFSCQPQQFSC